MSAALVKVGLFGLWTPLPAGNWHVDSPVIAVNEVFGANPYAWRSWLYVGIPWSRARWMSIAARSVTPVKHGVKSTWSTQVGSLPVVGTWNSTLRMPLSNISSLRY